MTWKKEERKLKTNNRETKDSSIDTKNYEYTYYANVYNAKENGRKLYNDSDDMSPFDSEENDSNDENNPANEYPDSYTDRKSVV